MTRGLALVVVAVVASAALVTAYLAAGGSDYEPTQTADPCLVREWRSPEGIEESAQQFALSALDGAACELEVSREELAIALASEESRAEFAAERGTSDAQLETAVRAGLVRGVDDAEAAGALSPLIADGARALAKRVPVDEAIALIQNAEALFGDATSLFGGLLDQAESLIP
ncbi:MAG TPA: hypothetical protein VHF58_05350 [Solirubrobacterales bacterium]|nr:hypothetical protein [Solirubrobacterales bacterium]